MKRGGYLYMLRAYPEASLSILHHSRKLLSSTRLKVKVELIA